MGDKTNLRRVARKTVLINTDFAPIKEGEDLAEKQQKTANLESK